MRLLQHVLCIICVTFLFSCKKEKKPILLSGRYKMVFGYHQIDVDGEMENIYSDGLLISEYMDFIDSNRVLLSDTIGFPGLIPVISSAYSIEGNLLYVDSAEFSPFTITKESGNAFSIERKHNSSGLRNRYSK